MNSKIRRKREDCRFRKTKGGYKHNYRNQEIKESKVKTDLTKNQNTYLEERFESLENAYERDKKFKVITEELIDMEDKKIYRKDIQHS